MIVLMNGVHVHYMAFCMKGLSVEEWCLNGPTIQTTTANISYCSLSTQVMSCKVLALKPKTCFRVNQMQNSVQKEREIIDQ